MPLVPMYIYPLGVTVLLLIVTLIDIHYDYTHGRLKFPNDLMWLIPAIIIKPGLFIGMVWLFYWLIS